MSDKDDLRARGIQCFSLVDELGVSTDGTGASLSTIRARGMEPICEVNSSGVATSGSTLAQMRARAIRVYCPVTENAVTSDAVSLTTLRSRGIYYVCPVDVNGIAIGGTATLAQIAAKGIQPACFLDSSGSSSGINLSALVLPENSADGTAVGTLSVSGGSGTYTFTLTDTAGGRFKVAGVNGVNLQAGATASNAEVATSYNITVHADNGAGSVFDRTFAITITDVNEAMPVITSNGGGASASVSVAENTTAVTTVVATDADVSAVITYSISGGADAAKFQIGPSSGVLSFVTAPDFEIPTDADTNNQYVVIVRASDGTNTDTQTITVTVTDVGEGGGGSAPMMRFNVASNSQLLAVLEDF